MLATQGGKLLLTSDGKLSQCCCGVICPPNPQMQVAVSGLTLCPGCILGDGYLTATDVSLNGTFVFDRYSDESTCNWAGSGGSYNRQTYFDSDCTSPNSNQTVGTIIAVEYLTFEGLFPGGWQVRMLWDGGIEILFQAIVDDLDSPIANGIGCASPPVGPGFLPVAFGGTITCTLL